MTWDDDLAAASGAWTRFCRALETTGAAVLADTLTHDEVDLAEGLRHLARMTALTLMSSIENKDPARPYLWTALDPHRKMGGDNPQGLYLSAPVDGATTYRLTGRGGNPRWVSVIVGQGGPEPFGSARFLPDLVREPDGRIEIVVSPDPHAGNWLPTDARSTGVLIRQFFATPDRVEPIEWTIEPVTPTADLPAPLRLASVVGGVDRAAGMFTTMLPMMQGELLDKRGATNTFATDIGDPTSTSGGVPGGNAVTALWSLAADEALLVRVAPPAQCAYWDVQVGSCWYESFDYRHRFSGLTCEGAHLEPDGSVVLVIADRDPGTANWLEAAGHRAGHVAIRWQLTDGDLPLPDTEVVPVDEVAARTGLPAVTPEARAGQRAPLATSFAARFGF